MIPNYLLDVAKSRRRTLKNKKQERKERRRKAVVEAKLENESERKRRILELATQDVTIYIDVSSYAKPHGATREQESSLPLFSEFNDCYAIGKELLKIELPPAAPLSFVVDKMAENLSLSFDWYLAYGGRPVNLNDTIATRLSRGEFLSPYSLAMRLRGGTTGNQAVTNPFHADYAANPSSSRLPTQG